MRHRALLTLLLVLALAACGGDDSADTTIAAVATSQAQVETTTTAAAVTTTTSPATTTTAAPTTTTTTTTLPPTTTTRAPIPTVTGTGDDVIDYEIPGDHVAALHITYTGDSNFVVESLGEGDADLDLLVNEIGNYEGTVPVNLDADEVVRALRIQSSGEWTIDATVAADLPVTDLSSAQGTGSDVLFVEMEAEGTRSRVTHDGDSNFVVIAWTALGTDLLVNEIGAYEGTVSVPPFTMIIIVDADGAWSFSEA